MLFVATERGKIMADYIDRREAFEIASDLRDCISVEGYWAWAERIKRLPSADAVEVVRCRDCKHRYVDGENVRYNVCDLNHNKVQEDDWYCADGERKDG